MRKKHSSLKDVLRHALPSNVKERVYSVELVARRWSDVVGKELGRRSEPEALSGGVLTVRVTDAVWGKMIYRLQDRIVPRLNRAVGMSLVQRINFTKRSQLQGLPQGPAEHTSEREPLVPPAELSELASGIQDAELRELVLQSAARYLRAKEQRGRQGLP